jgi:hypothetical protein
MISMAELKEAMVRPNGNGGDYQRPKVSATGPSPCEVSRGAAEPRSGRKSNGMSP